MNSNNRQPAFKPKIYPERKVFHTEVKDGKTIFVEGVKPSPYDGVMCESLKLKSRIETGTFQDHEGALHKLEKANGADIMTETLRKEEEKLSKLKVEKNARETRKRIRQELEKDKPEVAKLIED